MFYWIVKVTLRPVFRVLFRAQVVGAEHIPARGGVLLASNHLSMCDSLFLPVMVRRRVRFLAKQEYFTGRGLRGRAVAAFVRGTGLIPIDRADPDAASAALDAGARAVRAGHLLGIYPEGTRSPDGRLYRGKSGLARIALDTGVPIVPVGMIGTDRVQPIGARLPRPGRVRIVIGPPLLPPAPDPASRRRQAYGLTEQVMVAIADLSGQTRAGQDAADHKRELNGRHRTESPAPPPPTAAPAADLRLPAPAAYIAASPHATLPGSPGPHHLPRPPSTEQPTRTDPAQNKEAASGRSPVRRVGVSA